MNLEQLKIKVSDAGLSYKVLVIIATVSLVGALISSALVLTLERQQLIDNSLSTTTRLSDGIHASLEYAMLLNDREMANQIIQRIVQKQDIEHIRILDADGIVTVSSLPREIGNHFDYSNPTCQFCHSGESRPSNQTAIQRTQDQREALVNINLIYNQPQCYQCHNAQNKILGLLVVEQPLVDLNNQLTAALWRISIPAFVTFGLMAGLMILALRKLIIQPVGDLDKGIREISAGNLDYVLPITNHDELGNLAESFDAMRKQLKVSRSEMSRRTQELAILNDLALGTSESLDLQQILELAIETVINKLGMHAGGIYLRDEDTGQFTLRASRGLSDEQCRAIELHRRQQAKDLAHQVADSGQEIIIRKIGADERVVNVGSASEQRSHINVPLKSKAKVVGTMGLITYPRQLLTERDIAVLKAAGHEVGIAIDNALLLAETRQREQETVTLYHLMAKISSSLELNQVLDAVADGARQLLNADVGVVGLVDEQQHQIQIKACVGNRTDILRDLPVPMERFFPKNASSVDLISIDKWESNLPIPRVAELIAEEGFVSSLAAPMWCNGRPYGFVGVNTRQLRRFSKRDIQLFMRLVMQVVTAIENADLYKQVRYVATLEERDRLAREMHDNLAQMLGYMNIKTTIADDQLAANQIDSARSSVLELKQIVQEAYTDVREVIYNLRSTSLELGLVRKLAECLAEYRAQYGIDAQLVVEPGCYVDFPPEVQVQVNRIIQEALTNVRKHSGACQARVRFQQTDHHVRISIEDNGKGFDPARLNQGDRRHVGLAIMRERAESVGGELSVDSRERSGTRIILTVPIYPVDEVLHENATHFSCR